MAVQAKEPISKAESNGALHGPRRAAVPFVAPDVDVVLKPLIQSFQTLRPYPQSISIRFSSTVFLAKVLEVFSPPADDFSPIDRFSSPIEPPVFPPRFLIEFKRFFHQSNTHGFLLSFPLGLGGFFPNAMISNAYTLVGARVQEGRQL